MGKQDASASLSTAVFQVIAQSSLIAALKVVLSFFYPPPHPITLDKYAYMYM